MWKELILWVMTNEAFADRVLDIKNYKKTAVRGVILDQENKVAIIYSPKEHYYKLPGGWVEEGESVDIALQRECKEEIGVDIEKQLSIGTVVEQNTAGEILQKNIGYCAHVVGEKWTNALTDVEQERKFEVQRKDIHEAIDLMTKNSPTSYRWTFMQTRDLKFLQEAQRLFPPHKPKLFEYPSYC